MTNLEMIRATFADAKEYEILRMIDMRDEYNGLVCNGHPKWCHADDEADENGNYPVSNCTKCASVWLSSETTPEVAELFREKTFWR